jgi:predicted dehydrogenase
LKAFQKLPNLNLLVICDMDADRARAAAVEFGTASYSHIEELLTDSAVDIVAINTPPYSHAALSMAALQAGKHVFCEKPLATSLAEAEAVLRLAGETGVTLSVDYVVRISILFP